MRDVLGAVVRVGVCEVTCQFNVSVKQSVCILTCSLPGLSLLTAPVYSSKLISAFSSRLSTTSTIPLQPPSTESTSRSRGRTISVLPVALPRRRSARPRSRAFCLSSPFASDASSERWKPRSSDDICVALRVVATSDCWMESWSVLKSPNASIVTSNPSDG